MRSDRLVCVVSLIAIVSGCSVAPHATPLTQSLSAPARDRAAFWAELTERPIATNDDALHAILIFLDDADECPDYPARVAELRSRGVLSPSFDAPPEQAVTRGTIAVAVARMLGIRGGITMSLLGTNGRYAIRELEFRQLFPPSTPNQIFSGPELYAVFDRMHSYVAGDPAEYPASATRAQMRGKGRIAVARRSAVTAHAMIDEPKYLSNNSGSFASEITLAQLPGTTPTTTSDATTEPAMRTFVISQLDGQPQVKMGPGQPWIDCQPGMQLPSSASVRMGPKEMVWIESAGQRFRVAGGPAVRLDWLTTSEGIAQTRVEMTQGTVNLDLESGGPTSSNELRSQRATLAVRGTVVSLYDQPGFDPRATSLTGVADFENYRRQFVRFGKRGAPIAAANRTVVTGDTPDPAAVAYSETVVDPTLRGARTESEQQLVAQFLSRGSTVNFDRNTGLLIVRGGSVPSNFTPFYQGNFNVVLTWNGNVDLNLGVASPGTDNPPPRPAEFVYPSAGLTRTPNGGITRFDHRGGASGGYEVVSFARFDGSAGYAVVVDNINPTRREPVEATLRLALEGRFVEFTGDVLHVAAGEPFPISVQPDTSNITFLSDINQEPFFFPSSTKTRKAQSFVGPIRSSIPPMGPVRPAAKSSKSKR